MASIRSVWGKGLHGIPVGREYPGSMRSIERGNELYKIRGRENGLHEINGGEISGDDSITRQRTDAPR